MKVLAVGDQADKIAVQFFDNAQIDKVAAKPHNWQMKGIYDALLSYHALPRFSHRDAPKALKMWIDCLKQGGDFHLYVPSLEWAARQILSPTPSKVVEEHLFGMQGDAGEHYSSGYILRDLRTLCDKLGIDVLHARVGEYMIGDSPCEMHLLLGKKR